MDGSGRPGGGPPAGRSAPVHRALQPTAPASRPTSLIR